MNTDKKYIELARRVLNTGEEVDDRTGTGTISLPHQQLQFDLSEGFPILQTKKVSFHAVKHELLWFLSGETSAKYLKDNNVKIWDEWLDSNGDAGKIYGHNWTNFAGFEDFAGVDQIANLIRDLKTNPKSRRMVVTSWNPEEMDSEFKVDFLALPPCHCFFQVTTHGNKINLMLHQRSVDVFLGLPFNITSYALLMHLLAKETGMDVGLLTMNFGDCHIYKNHVNQVMEQNYRFMDILSAYKLFDEPELVITPTPDKDKNPLECYDIELHNYNPMSAIKAPVSV